MNDTILRSASRVNYKGGYKKVYESPLSLHFDEYVFRIESSLRSGGRKAYLLSSLVIPYPTKHRSYPRGFS